MFDVTRIVSDIEQGEPGAASQLLPLIYDELRKLAAQRLAHEYAEARKEFQIALAQSKDAGERTYLAWCIRPIGAEPERTR
jgi:hypothetical protein